MTKFWGIFFLSFVSESNHYKINPQKPVLIHDKALFIGLFSFLQIYKYSLIRENKLLLNI